MFKKVLFITIILVASFNSKAIIMPTDIDIYLQRAEQVLVVSIIKSESFQEYTEGLRWACGYKYTAEVEEVLKGLIQPTSVIDNQLIVSKVTFAGANPMMLGQRYLVALRHTSQDFQQTDSIITYPNDGQKNNDDCLKKLPTLREDWFFTSEFANYDSRWVKPSFGVKIPESIEVVSYNVSKVIIDEQETNPYNTKHPEVFPNHMRLRGSFISWEEYKSYILKELEEDN